MPTITIDDVKKVAILSGLNLSDEELQTYTEQFEKILGYIERLNSVDTAGIEPTYQVTGLKNVMRQDDIIDYGLTSTDLLKNAPETESGQIKVRRVL